jgi:hypothetical protein
MFGRVGTRAQASIASAMILLVALPGAGLAGEQQPAAVALNIVIVEGEGAINNPRLRTAREPIVEVQDENHKPVAGALVLFATPDHGAGATFTNGLKTLSVTTDSQGRATAQGFKPNSTAGTFQIVVTATYLGRTAQAKISQTNLKGGMGIPGKAMIIGAVVAAGIIAGVVVATRGGGGGTSTTPTVITPGSPGVGGSR